MARRLVLKALKRQSYTHLRGDGDHDVYGCPCDAGHIASVPRHTTISPGVIRNIIRDNPCRPNGWLQ